MRGEPRDGSTRKESSELHACAEVLAAASWRSGVVPEKKTCEVGRGAMQPCRPWGWDCGWPGSGRPSGRIGVASDQGQ
jgi:hypothetical protein